MVLLTQTIINMKVERRIHSGWQNFQDMSDELKSKLSILGNMFGKYQYIYSSSIGEISLVHLAAGLSDVKVWEIYCFKGNLFDDVERFRTKKDALIRIKELLLEDSNGT